jgi:hypothetical protein
MACVAVETLKRALTQSGPSVLQSMAFDHYDSDTGKAVNRPRLQTAGKGPAGDVHNLGLALDIIIYAAQPPVFAGPSPERDTGYGLVNIFLGLQPSMGWRTMIYDSKEWTNGGAAASRTDPPYKTEMARVEYEHLTHIHIDWPQTLANKDDFYDELVQNLNDAGY